MLSLKNTLLIIFILILNGCAIFTETNSLFEFETTSESVENGIFRPNITQASIETKPHLCADFLPELFWTQGVYAEELNTQLVSSIVFTIDNETIDQSLLSMLVTQGLYRVYDEGELIGSYGTGISVCADISDLDAGLHSGTMQLTDLSNSKYEAHWEFEVSD